MNLFKIIGQFAESLRFLPVYKTWCLLCFIAIEYFSGYCLGSLIPTSGVEAVIYRSIYFLFYELGMVFVIAYYKINYVRTCLKFVPREARVFVVALRSLVASVFFVLVAGALFLGVLLIVILSGLLGLSIVGLFVFSCYPWVLLISGLIFLYVTVFFFDYIIFENSGKINFSDATCRLKELSSKIKGYRIPLFTVVGVHFAIMLSGSALNQTDLAYGITSFLTPVLIVGFQLLLSFLYAKRYLNDRDDGLSEGSSVS